MKNFDLSYIPLLVFIASAAIALVNFLRDFSEYIGQPVAGSPTLEEDLANLRAADQRIREKAEELIEALRDDIGTRRLNIRMTRR